MEKLTIGQKLNQLKMKVQDIKYENNLSEILFSVPKLIQEIKEILIRYSNGHDKLHEKIMEQSIPILDKEIEEVKKLYPFPGDEKIELELKFIKQHIVMAIDQYFHQCTFLKSH